MSLGRRLASLAVCVSLTIGGTAAPAVSATPEMGGACGAGLPSSKLALLDARFHHVEQTVGTRELAAAARRMGGHAGRGFLLTDPPARVSLSIQHRVIRSPSDPRMFCNAPVRVNVVVGFGERRLLATRKIAEDRCVMDALRAHEALHAASEERELRDFMATHGAALGAAMAKIKAVPAPSVAVARQQFEAAGHRLVQTLEHELMVRKAELRRQVDTNAELSDLAGRCGGRVGQFSDGRSLDI